MGWLLAWGGTLTAGGGMLFIPCNLLSPRRRAASKAAGRSILEGWTGGIAGCGRGAGGTYWIGSGCHGWRAAYWALKSVKGRGAGLSGVGDGGGDGDGGGGKTLALKSGRLASCCWRCAGRWGYCAYINKLLPNQILSGKATLTGAGTGAETEIGTGAGGGGGEGVCGGGKIWALIVERVAIYKIY